MNKSSEVNFSNKVNPNYFFCLVIALYSIHFFFLRGATAFEWPALDMAPFFERMNDAKFLTNDFFSNTSSVISPRHVYGYFVVFLANLFHTDWYSIFFLILVAYVVLIPTMIYLFLFGIVRDKIQPDKIFVTHIFLTLIICLLIKIDFSYTFSIAWWPPLAINATNQNFSLFLFLIGSMFLLYGNSKIKNLYLVFWLFATLVHFAIGIFLITFYFLSTADKFNFISLLKTVAATIVLPVFILFALFTSETVLSAKEFIQVYIERHSKHYVLSELGTMTSYPWWVSLLLVVGMICIPLVIGIIRKSNHLKLISSFYLLCYLGAIAIQYVGIEIVPSKFIAALCPIRFSFLGYWMLMVLYTLLILEIKIDWSFLNKVKNKFFVGFIKKIETIFSFLNGPVFSRSIYFISSSIVVIAVFYFIAKDDPYTRIKSKDQDLYNWIEKNSNSNDVFASYMTSDHVVYIPLVAKRAVFIGNGFPFNEKFFKEYQERSNLIYGPFKSEKETPGKDIYERANEYYANLSQENFISISQKYKLDYVIMNAEGVCKLNNCKPVFENKKVKVFKVEDFKKAK